MFDLSEDELQSFKKAFDLFDKDGNGDINKEEIIMAFNQLNIRLSDQEINNIFKKFDENGNQSIEFEEFVTILKNNLDRDQSQSWLMEVFEIIDQDCDGRLNKQQLMRIIQLYELDITEKDLNQILETFDDTQSKGITYEAFSALLKF